MGMMEVLLSLFLGALCVLIHTPAPALSSCSNLTPCNEKGGTCMLRSSCTGKKYTAVRYCKGAGCICCLGSPPGNGNSHGSCRVGQSCGRRGRCTRGSCRSGYSGHAGDCGGGGNCRCCARDGGDLPYDPPNPGPNPGGQCRQSGKSCGSRGTCRNNCWSDERLHSGGCGNYCTCCAKRNPNPPHNGGQCRQSGKSCGSRGTCRNNCWSDESLHSGGCGNYCTCCAKGIRPQPNGHCGGSCGWGKTCRSHRCYSDEYESGSCSAGLGYHCKCCKKSHSPGYCGGSCGWKKTCRSHHCLSDEYESGTCNGYHCKCCKKYREQKCFHPGINCDHGRGTCYESQCPSGHVSRSTCAGHNCVCCVRDVVSPVSVTTKCSGRGGHGYCRLGSCFGNEYSIGACPGMISYLCCVQNLPACHAHGASCLGSGSCRVGACNNNEIQSGTCHGINCVCCTPYAISVCTNVNGPCNGHTGMCRSVCLPGEIDRGLGTCLGTSCRCCKLPECPAAQCIKGLVHGTCRSLGCQKTEFDIGECLPGRTNCRCCTQQVRTCPLVGSSCGRRGRCRTGSCQAGEVVHSGDCGGGSCACCASTIVKRQVNSEDLAGVAETDDNVVKKDSAIFSTTDDGGMCPNGYMYIASQCLLFNVKESVEWDTAEQICGQLRGRLVNVLDPNTLSTFFKTNYVKNNFWLGARDSSSPNEGTWRWTNGYIMDKSFPWSETKNMDNQECLEWDANMQGYQGNNCVKSQNFICESTTTGNVEYKKSIGQVTYIDECKKIEFMEVIQLICTRRQMPLRSGKSIGQDYLEDNDLHSLEKYRDNMEHDFYSHIDETIEGIHIDDFGMGEMEFYDSEEERMIKQEFLDDLYDLDYLQNGTFNYQDTLIQEEEAVTLSKENIDKLLSTSTSDKEDLGQEFSETQASGTGQENIIPI